MQRNSKASCIRIHAHYHQLGGGTPTSGENCWNISSKGNCEFSFLEFANFLSRCWDLLLTKLFLTELSLTKLSFLLLTKLSLPNCHLPNCHLPNCYLPNLPYQKSARLVIRASTTLYKTLNDRGWFGWLRSQFFLVANLCRPPTFQSI